MKRLVYLAAIVLLASCSSPKLASHLPEPPAHPRFAPVPMVPKPAPTKLAVKRIAQEKHPQ